MGGYGFNEDQMTNQGGTYDFNDISIIKSTSIQDAYNNLDDSPKGQDESSYVVQLQQQDYEESMQAIWTNCEHLIESLSVQKS